MSCQPIAGYEREMFSAGCTMNIGSKKLLREVASTFCGAQDSGVQPVPMQMLKIGLRKLGDWFFSRGSKTIAALSAASMVAFTR
jgi:hypothetical protein